MLVRAFPHHFLLAHNDHALLARSRMAFPTLRNCNARRFQVESDGLVADAFYFGQRAPPRQKQETPKTRTLGDGSWCDQVSGRSDWREDAGDAKTIASSDSLCGNDDLDLRFLTEMGHFVGNFEQRFFF